MFHSRSALKALTTASVMLAAFGWFAEPAAAQGLDVALLATDHVPSLGVRWTDPQAKLLASGKFSSVDLFDIRLTTPSSATLSQYDAVMLWVGDIGSSLVIQDRVLLGDNLADYLDAGGGVVIAGLTQLFQTAPSYLEGRWLTGGYEIIENSAGVISFSQATLGLVHQPSHPVMQGVNTFDGGFMSYRPELSATLTPGSTLIAEWSDGTFLVAESGTFGFRRIDLGMYPVSGDVRSIFWDTTTDGDILMSNALEYVAGGPSGMRLSVSGPCPGSMTFQVDGATPTRRVLFTYATGLGSFTIPGGFPCSGTTLGLNNSVQLAGIVNANTSGVASLTANVPAKACGRVFIQALDEQTCTTTNVVNI